MKMSLLLALQVSTLTMQVGELERQVQGSSSEDIIKGVFMFIFPCLEKFISSGPNYTDTLLLCSFFLTPGIFILAKEALKDQRVCVKQ